MKKEEKKRINDACVLAWDVCRGAIRNDGAPRVERLRSCNAHVEFYNDYIVLVSYSTIVAFIDENGKLFDVLRLVYGYTATSAQHIAKFKDDFSWAWSVSYRYKE